MLYMSQKWKKNFSKTTKIDEYNIFDFYKLIIQIISQNLEKIKQILS